MQNRAVWGKGSQGVLRQIEDIEHGITFPILGFDCDNGSEFLNHHLVRYFTDRPKKPVMFSAVSKMAAGDTTVGSRPKCTAGRHYVRNATVFPGDDPGAETGESVRILCYLLQNHRHILTHAYIYCILIHIKHTYMEV